MPAAISGRRFRNRLPGRCAADLAAEINSRIGCFRGDAACEFRWIIRAPPIDAAGRGEQEMATTHPTSHFGSPNDSGLICMTRAPEEKAGAEHPQSDRGPVPDSSELNRVLLVDHRQVPRGRPRSQIRGQGGEEQAEGITENVAFVGRCCCQVQNDSHARLLLAPHPAPRYTCSRSSVRLTSSMIFVTLMSLGHARY